MIKTMKIDLKTHKLTTIFGTNAHIISCYNLGVFMRYFLIGMFSFFLSLSVNAEITTGRELYELCQSEEPMEKGICMGTIDGMTEAIQVFRNSPKYFCLKKGTSKFDIIDIVLAYLTKHPDTRNKQAIILIITSLKESMPCR